jgi:hypothetical protein
MSHWQTSGRSRLNEKFKRPRKSARGGGQHHHGLGPSVGPMIDPSTVPQVTRGRLRGGRSQGRTYSSRDDA